ncbi:head decoration protein [Virgibacillus halodenitrificans]|uniref:head decoration protein n=1 Tax=Virgibacillus halodenitrificans TaxID=1482 RepID=UPI000EF4B30B|nr:head decoration protein [Virgibacillus halodenitrificans]
MPLLGEFNYDNLFAGDFDIVTDTVTAGADLTRGTVVGIVTTGGAAVPVDSAAADGSQNAYAVVADDAKTGEDTTVYLTGEFNSNALTFGGTDTASDHKQALRALSIFLKENV